MLWSCYQCLVTITVDSIYTGHIESGYCLKILNGLL